MRGWRELRAFARLELGLQPQEFESTTPLELETLITTWQQREQRIDNRLASLMAQVSNVVIAAAGGKTRFKSSDFISGPKPASRKMSASELRSMAVLAFGPPPKKKHTAKTKPPAPCPSSVPSPRT